MLAAELHERPVEAAERAVVLLTPPAAPGTFHDQPWLHPGARGRRLETLEETIEGRRQDRAWRQGAACHRVDHGGSVRAPPAQPWHRRQLRTVVDPGGENVEQRREGTLPLATHDEVDEREVAVQRGALGTVTIGPTEHRPHAWSATFEQPGHRQTRSVLLEGGGETDHIGIHPVQLARQPLDEVRR